jgi:predicted ATPase/class 3 adenylate cyclase
VGAPTGTVTFLFTDIEGSTQLWEAAPEEMRTALARHDALLRASIERHGGYVFSTGGDGFGAAFARPAEATVAASGAQAALADEEWPAHATIRVRMGLHTGAAEERDGDYFGPAVNRAARLTALAHGRQILCSSVTAELLDRAELIDLGEHRLRDLSAPQRVFQVGEGRFPPLRSLDSFPGNLPLQTSSFIGRDADLARTDEALRESRVVTLTGVGGVGKTRLALQVAGLALPRFRDGAWLCELQTVRDPTRVGDAVATVLDVSVRTGRSLEESLVEFLRGRQLLLVLDNAEHLLDAVAELVELLERSCAGLVVLVTSREGLAVGGERVVPVPSLPAPSSAAGAEAAAAADAVRLFVERARAVDPDFALSEANAASVAEVCRRLDGVPLAIELAAARVSAMTLTELAAGLDRRFATLAGGRRRAVQRYQTLRAAIDWSYELLTDTERRLLARLAVFAGGCTRSAAEHVCGGPPLSAGQVFDALAGLVAKSLVVAQREGAEARYRLLETIREYGEERLAELGETEMLRAAHAEYFYELMLGMRDQLYGPEQINVARRLATDHDNLVAAVQHALDTVDADLALRLVYVQPPMLAQVGYQLRLPVEDTLRLPGASTHPLYAYALTIVARLAAFHGDMERAEAAAAEALAAIHVQGGDWEVEASAYTTRAGVASARGAFTEAAQMLTEIAEFARSAGTAPSKFMAGFWLQSAAMCHTMAGNAEAGAPFAAEAVAIARETGAPLLIALTLVSLAGALAGSDPARARAALDESLRVEERSGSKGAPWATQSTLVAARLGDWPLVLRLSVDALRHIEWSGDRGFVTFGVINVVARAVAPRDAEPAAVLQGAARRLALAAGGGSSPQEEGVDQTSRVRDRVAGPAPFIADLRRQATAVLRETMGDDRWRELRAEGEAMDVDDVVRYALTVVQRNLTPVRQESWIPVTPGDMR